MPPCWSSCLILHTQHCKCHWICRRLRRQNTLNFSFNLNSQQDNHVYMHKHYSKGMHQCLPGLLESICVELWCGPWWDPGFCCGEGSPDLLLAQCLKWGSETAGLNILWSNFRALGVVDKRTHHTLVLISVCTGWFPTPLEFLGFILTPWSSLSAEVDGSVPFFTM